jgi:hypothetical protein
MATPAYPGANLLTAHGVRVERAITMPVVAWRRATPSGEIKKSDGQTIEASNCLAPDHGSRPVFDGSLETVAAAKVWPDHEP